MEVDEEMEPETLSLWHKMIEALKSHIKYSYSVKKTVSDIKVTDIFCDLDEEACRIIYSNSLYINLIRICLHVSPQGIYDARVLNVCFPT